MYLKIIPPVLILIMIQVSPAASERRILAASTTSTQNSGFFDYILPVFADKSGIRVDIVAVGTGAAIEIGRRGDADLVLVHARELELKAVEEGHYLYRHDIMYNDFVLTGPSGDPAGIRDAESAAAAFRKIAESAWPFVSRGDRSGTHTKELSIWRLAEIDPGGEEWYLEVGQGMEKALRIAGEKLAYTLTDRGTWLAAGIKRQPGTAVLFEGDPVLYNQYGVMAVNPLRHPHVKYDEAVMFINWLVSVEGQETVASFRDDLGNQLFIPNALRSSGRQP